MTPNASAASHDPSLEGNADSEGDSNTLSPLPGELGIPNVAAKQRMTVSRKGLLAVSLLMGSLVAVSTVTIQRFAAGGKKAPDAESKLMRDRPTAAVSEPRTLEMPLAHVGGATPASAVPTSGPRIPALIPNADEMAEPIDVRRTGAVETSGSGGKAALPEDAPVLLVASRTGAATHRAEPLTSAPDTNHDDPLTATSRNLEGYQRQLQGLLDNLTKTAASAAGQPAGPLPSTANLGATPLIGGAPGGMPAAGAGLFGGQLQSSATPTVAASMLANRSLTLTKGTAFTCALKTRVISATSGLVGCQVQRNVFSDDGRVLLIERGSHLDGEYRIASVRPGTVRIPVLWTRIRTPLGVTVDLDSPATGPLGESGLNGYVDNRWLERIGAAMLLSLIDDSVKLVIQSQTNDTQANTVVLPSTTANTSKLAEKVLDSTINIPPLVYQNQGGIVGVYVARDVDFSSVYELKPVARGDTQ